MSARAKALDSGRVLGCSSAPPPRDGADAWQINQVLQLSKETFALEEHKRARAFVLSQRRMRRRLPRQVQWWASGGPDILGQMMELSMTNDDLNARITEELIVVRAATAAAAAFVRRQQERVAAAAAAHIEYVSCLRYTTYEYSSSDDY